MELFECQLLTRQMDSAWVYPEEQMPTGLSIVEADSHEQAARMYAATYCETHPAFFEGTARIRILCSKEHKDFTVTRVPAIKFTSTPV